jgi:hypothetical protein
MTMKFERKTIFSDDRKFRYALWREWDLPRGLPYGTNGADGFKPLPLHAASEFCMFIGLNPSTANEMDDDPTIRRCVRFARDWGFGGICMTNLFPMVTAYPDELDEVQFSDENRELVMDAAKAAGKIICCWGNFSQAQKWGRALIEVLVEDNLPVSHLGQNQNGSPKHPLYLKRTTQPTHYLPRRDG